jgi:hypothetical protein
MSHIAEVYAKDLGVKIGKPQITEHFFPICEEKYITFQNPAKMQAQQYDYWDIVLYLIKEELTKKGIKIIQIGGLQDIPTQFVDKFIPSSFKQMNYIIKNSLLHVGLDSLPGHVASVYDVPSVILHFNLYKENSKPIWHRKSKCISLEPDFSKIKPSYNTEEHPKRVNEIKPEVIAQAIFEQLNIKNKINFKTIRCGSRYHFNAVEIIPDFFGYNKDLVNKPINLRADLHFDLQNIFQWSRMCKLNLIINKPLSDEAILAIKENTEQVVFKLDNLEEDFNLFFKKLQRAKINLTIVTRNKDIVSELRLKYFDFNVFLEQFHKKEDINHLINENTKYLSKKSFISKGQSFNSEFAYKLLDNSIKYIHNNDSIKELENFYLYE